MNLHDLKKLLKPADVLLIVPPFVLENFQSMGAHILQACCKQAGFSVQIFYANILFASHIKEDYEILVKMSNYLIGERIFSRAAFGDNGYQKIHENIYNNSYTFGPQIAGQIHNSFYSFPRLQKIDLSRLKEIEEKAFNWVEEISQLLAHIPYKIIGCTSTFEQICSSFALLKGAKKNNPDITTIMGGNNCEGLCAEGIASLDPEQNIIDYIFSGESENSLIDFLTIFKNGIKEKNRIIYGNPCTDLDSLPEVDYTQYFEQIYSFQPSYVFNPEKLMIFYETSRGCWWGEKNQCLFCGLNGDRITFRQKTPGKVIKNLMEFKKYNIPNLQMTDAIMPDNYFTTLLPSLAKENHSFNIFYEQKANLSFNQLKLLKNAGITEIQPGIETFSNKLLRQMRKNTKSWQNIQTLRDALTLQIHVYWNFLWGFPNEESQEYMDMIGYLPLLIHLPPPTGVFHLGLTRFSPYFNNSELYGIKNIKALDSYREILPSHADVQKIAIFFRSEYTAETYQNPVVISQFMDMIHEWNQKWHSVDIKPVLHLSKECDNQYILTDTRNLTGTESSHTMSKQRAAMIQKDGKFTASAVQKWAVLNKLALVIENHFISLVTMPLSLKEELNSNEF